MTKFARNCTDLAPVHESFIFPSQEAYDEFVQEFELLVGLLRADILLEGTGREADVFFSQAAKELVSGTGVALG